MYKITNKTNDTRMFRTEKVCKPFLIHPGESIEVENKLLLDCEGVFMVKKMTRKKEISCKQEEKKIIYKEVFINDK